MNQNTLYLLMLLTIIILISYFFISYFNLKKKVIFQNRVIIEAIFKEKQLSKKLEITDTKMKEMERDTKVRFLKIRVSIFNIAFGFRELSNF